MEQTARVLRAGHRLILPLLIAALGTVGTLMVWARAQADHRSQLIASLTSVADADRGEMQRRIDQHIGVVHNLATLWQLYGLNDPAAWRFETQIILTHFPGVSWIGWVDRDSDDVRFVSRVPGREMSQTFVGEARARIETPGSDIRLSEGGDGIQVFLTVRTPQDRVGIILAGLSPDSMVANIGFDIAQNLAFIVRKTDGTPLVSRGIPAGDAPGWAHLRRALYVASGAAWNVEYVPTRQFLATTVSPWSDYFLLTGVLLSLALGAIVYQFLRLREYAAVLAEANVVLKSQVEELTRRDRELGTLNAELESRVAARTGELRETLGDLETFNHSLSHDLRSPIGTMLNYVAILEEDYGPQIGEEGRKHLGRIRASADSTVRLLDQLVQLSYLGHGDQVGRVVDMEEIARTAFHEAMAGDPSPGTAEFRMDPLPAAFGDPALVARVLFNLFSNALKYSRTRESRHIHMSATQGQAENTYRVTDNGIGFDPAQAGSMFEPFRRLHTATQYQGTGLGLAISTRFIKRQGGRIWAESDGATGASIFFTLPSGPGART